MAQFNFCGGSYTSQGVGFDCQRSVNLYPELHELGDGKSKMALFYTPGLKSFYTLDGPSRGKFEFNGRLFDAGQTNFYEIIPTYDAFGKLVSTSTTVLNAGKPLVNDGKPVSMAANETQLLIASGGFVFIYYLATTVDSVTNLPVAAGTFQQVAASNFTLSTGNAPVIQVAFCDSFFLALIANSQTICISNVLDGNNWNLNGQIVVSVYADNVVGMVVDHREVGFLGRKKSVIYFASGSLSVFDVSPGGFIEQGSGATFAISQLDNSVFWVGGDDRGNAQGWRLNGYTPVRVTTHPVELAWQSYPRISDAVSFAYQDDGHTFWQIYFPSANSGLGATWLYDTASQLWHERDNLNLVTGQMTAHPSWNHAFAFGQHFVGDWNSNKSYVMSRAYFDNDGTPVIRMRTAPHIFIEEERISHYRFELDMDLGVGWAADDTTHFGPPTIFLDWSNDGGKTWSNKQGRSFGYLGETRIPRPVWRRLGQARVRTYRVTCSDAVPVRIYNAYVNASPGFAPTERMVKQLAKAA